MSKLSLCLVFVVFSISAYAEVCNINGELRYCAYPTPDCCSAFGVNACCSNKAAVKEAAGMAVGVMILIGLAVIGIPVCCCIACCYCCCRQPDNRTVVVNHGGHAPGAYSQGQLQGNHGQGYPSQPPNYPPQQHQGNGFNNPPPYNPYAK
ncbi:hypothetical protein HDE_07895 [Halotydeus destructor]|nr:hypothetical protein HDE_07895 [Halotydeus destructor]